MKQKLTEQYTIRNIPAALNRTLRRQAEELGKSLNDVLLRALHRGAGLSDEATEHDDLDFLIGSWETDTRVEQALHAQRTIDRTMWR
ncbi:MAG: hypothetical protein HY696_01920 [Deltaproteobacteria bacterium]|nr:hypothetical protein [Deltaproteobacteria bacterium]